MDEEQERLLRRWQHDEAVRMMSGVESYDRWAEGEETVQDVEEFLRLEKMDC